MANRYWVGGTATWDATAGTKWATTSGGAGGAAVPTSADDVFFDASSGAVTVTTSGTTVDYANNLNFTGFTGTLNHVSSTTINVAGSLTYVTGMTYTRGGTSSALLFNGTTTGHTINFGGKTIGNVTINGVGGGWTVNSTMNMGGTGGATLNITNGTLNTNGFAVDASNLNLNNGTATLTTGASVIFVYNMSLAGTGSTLNAGTGTLAFQASGNFGSHTAYTVKWVGRTIQFGSTVSGAFTCTNLIFEKESGSYSGAYLMISNNITVTGTVSSSGTSSGYSLYIKSSVDGVARTITAGAFSSLSDISFSDITAAGASGTWTGTRIGDGGGNTNITGTTPKTLYFVSTTGGNWRDTARWSLTSGGATAGVIPLPQDTVIFDANSNTTPGSTITMNVGVMGKDISFAGLTTNTTLSLAGYSTHSFGNLTLNAARLTTTQTTAYDWKHMVRGNANFDGNNATVGASLTFALISGTLTFLDSVSFSTIGLRLRISGTSTVDFNGKTITTTTSGGSSEFSWQSGSTGTFTLNYSGATLNLAGSTSVFTWNATQQYLSDQNGLINVTTTGQTMDFPGYANNWTYPEVALTAAGGTLTFDNPTGETAKIKKITAVLGGQTLNFDNNNLSTAYALSADGWNVTGLSGSPTTIKSTSGGTHYITIPNTVVGTSNYLTISSSNVSGAGSSWYAGSNSTNVSGNTGWLFSNIVLGSATANGNSSITATGTISYGGASTITTGSAMTATANVSYNTNPSAMVGQSNINPITGNVTVSAQIQTLVGQSEITVSGGTSISSSTLNQTSDNDEVVSYEPGVNGGGALARAGQQFTVPTGQTSISQIRLKVRLYDPGVSASVVLKAFASGSATTGTPLATSNATTVSSLTNADHMFTFSPAWSVTPGTSLFFGVYSSTEMIAVRYQNTDVYAGGNRWHASYGGAGGTTAFQSDIGDLNFSLYTLVPGITGGATITTGSEMTVSGTAKFFSTSTITTGSNFTAVGSRQVSASASIVTSSNVTAVAVIGHIVNVNSDGNSNMTVSGAKNYYGIADPIGRSDIAVYGSKVHYGLASPQGNSSISILDVGIAITHLNISKSYIYKIYDKNWNYLGIWNDVVSEFGYSQEINSAGSSITVTLARNSDSLVANYASLSDDSGNTLTTDSNDELAAETSTLNAIGPGTTVDLNLNVKIYEFSSGPQAVEGDLVFTGYISMYSSKYGTTENTNVSLFSYGADLDNWLLVDSANNTRVPYLSKDPSVILKDTLDKFVAAGGLITYDTNSIANTNTLVSYAFNTNTELEAIKKCLELAPTDWYFYTDLATNLLHFQPRPSLVSHYFYLGRHIFSLDLDKSLEGIVNDVVFTGGKPENLVSDTFTMPTGQSLVAHTPETGSTWVQHGTTVANQSFVASSSGRIYKVGGGEAFFYNNVPMPTTDFDITANIYVASAANEMGVLGGLDANGDNGILAQISGTGLSVYSRTAGTWTQLGTTVAVSPTVGATYKMQLKREGQNIKLYWNNAAAIEVTSTASTASGVNVYTGIRASLASTATTGYHMDSFRAKLVDESLGTPVFKRYTNAASISAYRRGLSRISDGRVSVPSSADIIATTEINRQKEPRYRSKITIANGTYDIRSIKLGQLVGFRNFGNFVDDITMQVVRIDYTPDAVILQLDTLVPSVPKRLEDIKRNLNQVEVEDNPDAPAVVAL